jgi:hypothetical protein
MEDKEQDLVDVPWPEQYERLTNFLLVKIWPKTVQEVCAG